MTRSYDDLRFFFFFFFWFLFALLWQNSWSSSALLLVLDCFDFQWDITWVYTRSFAFSMINLRYIDRVCYLPDNGGWTWDSDRLVY